ncbi:MAG: hypothetical protein Kow00107_09860 [Planctomycetota bacterium]
MEEQKNNTVPLDTENPQHEENVPVVQKPEGEPVTETPSAPAPDDNRLTKAQKLFFLLVVIFTLFLLFLKLWWEPRHRGGSGRYDDNSPGIDNFEPGDENGSPEDWYAPREGEEQPAISE